MSTQDLITRIKCNFKMALYTESKGLSIEGMKNCAIPWMCISAFHLIISRLANLKCNTYFYSTPNDF